MPRRLPNFLRLIVLLNPLLEGFVPAAWVVVGVVPFDAVDQIKGQTDVATQLLPISSQGPTLRDHSVPVFTLYIYRALKLIKTLKYACLLSLPNVVLSTLERICSISAWSVITQKAYTDLVIRDVHSIIDSPFVDPELSSISPDMMKRCLLRLTVKI